MRLLQLLSCLFVFLLTSLTASQGKAAPPPAEAFGELPIAYDAAISPDGKHIAVVVNVEGEYVIYVQNIDNQGDPQYIRLGEGVKPGFIKWANDHRWVASINRQDTFRNTPYTASYLYSADIKTQESGLVVEPRGMFRQNNSRVIDWLEDDPNHILMAYSDKEFDPYPDIKKVNVATGRDRTVKRGKNGIEYWISDGDGTPRIGAGQTDGGDKKMIIYNSETQRWDRSDDYPGITPETDIYGILKDGTELVIADYQGRDTLGLYIYNLKQKKITRTLFHNDKYDASGVVLSKDGETVIGARYIADKDKIELLDKYGTLLDRLRAKFTDYTVDFVDQTENGKTVLVKMSAAYDPGGLYIFNSGDELPARLSRMYNEIVPDDLGNVSAVLYTARDGEKIPAFVTFPPSVKTTEQFKDLPFIILPHGGPYARDSHEFDYFAQFFATRGYGVLQMNFRGSEGYGKSFAEAGRSNWVVMQEDVEDGARWLMEKGYADPERTCIAGWSYGGYAALMGVATDPDLYKCAIAMAALTDIDEAKKDLKKYRGGKHAAEKFFGKAFEDKDLRRANSPVNVAENITVPVFLAHGDKDENVQFEQFERMKKALEKADVKATFLEFEDENHNLSVQKNRETFFVEMEKFLNDVNGPSEYMVP
jgi:dipeptidyl aminopeptidase/acylaminoacyl peptidase